jgi:hypothetical protein
LSSIDLLSFSSAGALSFSLLQNQVYKINAKILVFFFYT